MGNNIPGPTCFESLERRYSRDYSPENGYTGQRGICENRISLFLINCVQLYMSSALTASVALLRMLFIRLTVYVSKMAVQLPALF